MSTSKSVQKTTNMRLEPRTELKSGEFEFKLTSVLNRTKVGHSFAERFDAIQELAQFDLTKSDLTREKK